MVSIRPLISKSSSLFINPLVTVPGTPITIFFIVVIIIKDLMFMPIYFSLFKNIFCEEVLV